jgi:hypothetical protein
MKSMAALAVMLMALVVAQAPVTQLDHWLHAAGRAHVATPLTTALLDEHHDHGQGQGVVEAQDDGQPDGSAAPPFPHHHHDAPSAVALPPSPVMTALWSSPAELTPSASSSPPGAPASRQDRPPRITLEHLA